MSLAKIPEVYVVSDSLGETAESVAKATISQFDEDIDIIRVPFIRHAEQIQKVIDEAASHNAVVCHTLVSRELRETFEKIADAKGVRYVDILGPMMDTVGTITTTKPRMKPGIIHKLDEEYFKKVEAIEFAVKYDDGKNPAGFAKADVVLLGVSRTSNCIQLVETAILDHITLRTKGFLCRCAINYQCKWLFSCTFL